MIKAQTFDTCAHPGCNRRLHDRNATNVCRDHIHSDQCACLQCLGQAKAKLRVRSRAEMVALGLLPEKRVFT